MKDFLRVSGIFIIVGGFISGIAFLSSATAIIMIAYWMAAAISGSLLCAAAEALERLENTEKNTAKMVQLLMYGADLVDKETVENAVIEKKPEPKPIKQAPTPPPSEPKVETPPLSKRELRKRKQRRIITAIISSVLAVAVIAVGVLCFRAQNASEAEVNAGAQDVMTQKVEKVIDDLVTDATQRSVSVTSGGDDEKLTVTIRLTSNIAGRGGELGQRWANEITEKVGALSIRDSRGNLRTIGNIVIYVKQNNSDKNRVYVNGSEL